MARRNSPPIWPELFPRYGEDQSFISRIERMQRRLDVYEFAVFCRILQIDPGEVLREVRLDRSSG